MSNQDLDLAREWAEGVGKIEGLRPASRATVEVIQALPDQWIDAEKVREVISEVLASTLPGTVGRQVAEEYAALIGELLPTPSLPTLAELIEAGNDPQDYQWMQCTVEGRGDDTFVIASVREHISKVLLPDGMHEVKGNSQVTPLPDLPKLEWPGSHADTITAESVEDVQAGRVDDFEPALPRPEDVPAGEPWIVQHEGVEWVGCRNEPESRLPWLVIRRDEHQFDYCYDTDITLVSRLVPEVGA